MKCDECSQENGRRYRCPSCDALICPKCRKVHGALGKSGNHSVRNAVVQMQVVSVSTVAAGQ